MNKNKKYLGLRTTGVAVGIVAILLILCMVISLISVAKIRRTEPFRHGVDLALRSPEVRQALGESITVGWLPQGTVNDSNGGEADLFIDLRGADTNGTIRVVGANRNGTWTIIRTNF